MVIPRATRGDVLPGRPDLAGFREPPHHGPERALVPRCQLRAELAQSVAHVCGRERLARAREVQADPVGRSHPTLARAVLDLVDCALLSASRHARLLASDALLERKL